MAVDPEVARLISDLRTWCKQKHGRQTYIAKILGVDRKRISEWFARKAQPNLAVGLKIKTFLEGEKSGRGDKPS
jgi:predicted XRE-type DNA-binding protein